MRTAQEAKQFWDDRFSSGNYIYGTEPNTYFKEQLDQLEPGRLLLPAEGEGRNAIYAAREGWKVDAFDISEKGRNKAQELAKRNHVTINYYLSTYSDFDIKEDTYDAIGLIYAHLHKGKRRVIHQKLIGGLKPGGHLILEAFSKKQLGNDSGGPQDLDMLYDLDELQKDLEGLKILQAESTKLELKEGMHHEGTANVIRLLAQRPE
ncbi:class I SAM-dependent methyltransferase [Fodinibius sp.]|uniref:class I SAM-dependent methyltransferase n=1 Tax=Fodinibius sp. TaxID=1872440 RepID=UPI002ACE76A3|nr:class I SAM-dependent methyltransferase [Fodinibius sp.]MDZ7658302.1 class I SAM-dependent methyltransferase [Fodinibius sp.]